MGECQRRSAGFLGVLLALRTPRNEALLEAVVKQANTTRQLWLVACDANKRPPDNCGWLRVMQIRVRKILKKENKLVVSKGADACSGSK